MSTVLRLLSLSLAVGRADMILALGAGTAPAQIRANVTLGSIINGSRLLSVLDYSGLIPTCRIRRLQHQTCSLRGTNSSDASPNIQENRVYLFTGNVNLCLYIYRR